jgi:hypothetical protein
VPYLLAEGACAGVGVFDFGDPKAFAGHQRGTEGNLEGKLVRGAHRGIRHAGEHSQPLPEMADGFRMGRPLEGALAGPLPVADRLSVEPCLRVMVRQPFGLRRHVVGALGLEHLRNALMDLLPRALEQRLIGRLLNEGVLEGVFPLGKQPRLVEKLGVVQVGQATMQRLVGQIRQSVKEAPGDVGANHCGSLEKAFLLGGEAVQAGGQHSLHGRGHLNAWQGLRQVIGPRRAD